MEAWMTPLSSHYGRVVTGRIPDAAESRIMRCLERDPLYMVAERAQSSPVGKWTEKCFYGSCLDRPVRSGPARAAAAGALLLTVGN
jgi:hypothetical protein